MTKQNTKNICFFCQKEITDFNKANTIVNYNICNDCAEHMSKGITLIAVEPTPIDKEQVPICRYDTGSDVINLYPTGEWAVFTQDTIQLFFGDRANEIINKKISFVRPETFNDIKEIYKTMKTKDTTHDNQDS